MSIAVQVTMVGTPIGNVDGALLVIVSIPQLSVTFGVPKVNSVEQLEIFAGQMITGASLSSTVTVIEPLELFPQASVAVHVMVVVPTG